MPKQALFCFSNKDNAKADPGQRRKQRMKKTEDLFENQSHK